MHTNTNKKLSWIFGGLISISLVGTAVAFGGPGMGARGTCGPDLDGKLNSEQRAELYSSRMELMAQGQGPQEIREAHQALLAEWGVDIQLPERKGKKGPAFLEDLDNEQRAQLFELRQEGLAAGDTREEMHEARASLMESWGFDLPDKPQSGRDKGNRAGRGMRKQGEHPALEQLTDAQRTELEELRTDLHSQGLRGREMRDAIGEKLQSWGIERPEKCDKGQQARANRKGRKGRGERGMGMKAVKDQLNREQRAELFQNHQALMLQGASRQEVRTSQQKLLKSWGIETGSVDLPEFDQDWNQPSSEDNSTRHGVHPNPFNPNTVISFLPQQDGQVNLKIFDMRGALMRELSEMATAEQTIQFNWDGTNGQGNQVASGNYIYRIEAEGKVLDGRMTLVR